MTEALAVLLCAFACLPVLAAVLLAFAERPAAAWLALAAAAGLMAAGTQLRHLSALPQAFAAAALACVTLAALAAHRTRRDTGG